MHYLESAIGYVLDIVKKGFLRWYLDRHVTVVSITIATPSEEIMLLRNDSQAQIYETAAQSRMASEIGRKMLEEGLITIDRWKEQNTAVRMTRLKVRCLK
jgi:hypothetical protein